MKKLTIKLPLFNNSWYLPKYLMVMKLTVFIIIATTLELLAVESYSQATRLNVDLENSSVLQVLNSIEEQSEFYFLYSTKLVDVNRVVSVNYKDALINDVLAGLFKGTDVDYLVVEKQIVLSNKELLGKIPPGDKQQQDKTITGNITNEDGEPISGVTVRVKSTNIGTITDNVGNYEISVPFDAETLVFSFIGMKTTEVPIETKTRIDIVMVEELYGIQEVVAIGYGTQSKINLTGAVSSVDYDNVLENRPLKNASQALGGNVTGVWVSENWGEPGKEKVQLRVRGWGTLNNAEPLVIIDGVEGSFSELNPNDVRSISVLKDAASAAIYGSKAANGVIVVTTKSGNYNQKIRTVLSSYYGLQSLGRRYDLIDNSAEFMTLWNTALINKGSDPLFPNDVINDFENHPDDPFKYPNTNFFDHVFRTAQITNHNLAISGGSDNSKYFGSFNYLYQDGIIQRTNSERYGLKFNFESKINKLLTVGGILNGMFEASKSPCINAQTSYDASSVQEYGFLRDMMYVFANGAFPFIAPYTEDGRVGGVQALIDGEPITVNPNPMLFIENGLTQNKTTYAKMNAYANLRFTDYLILKSNFTTQVNNQLIDSYNTHMVGYSDEGDSQIYVDFPLQNIRDNINHYSYTWFNTLNFNKTFGENHDVSAIAGMQAENSEFKTLFARRTGIPKEGLTQVSAGTSGEMGRGNQEVLRILSYFGRVNYVFSDKYLIEMNFRADASSRFMEGYRWGLFPGFSAGWILSEENFIKDLNTFSNLKLRASWGSLGNQNIAGYWPYLAVINQNDRLSYNYGGSFAPGAAVTSMVDETITWETSTTTDVGLDFSFLNNRLSVVTDYFYKITSNILVQLPISGVMGGLTAPYQNIGEMLNKGIELNVNYIKPAGRDKIGFNLGANLTYILNEVTKFREDAPDQLYLIREGYPYRTLYGFNCIGVYKTDQEANEHLYANSFIPSSGQLKYEDVNRDGQINFNDKMDLGNTIPKYTIGGNMGLSYGGFELNILLQGALGMSVYTQNAWTQPLGINGATITKRWRDAWTPENSDAELPKLIVNDTWNFMESSFWVSQISFMKIRNIQLGYTFPNRITSLLGLQNNFYVYINAQNLHTFVNKDYEGFDPERNTFNSGEFVYPAPRVFSFGINVNF